MTKKKTPTKKPAAKKRGRPPGSKNKKSAVRKKPRSPKKPDLKKLMREGQAAKATRYQNYLTRIQNSETLTPTEIKDFNQVEKDLEEMTDGPRSKKTTIENNRQAAKYCAVSTRVISYHLHKGNIKQHPDGTFDLESIDKWLIKSGRKVEKKAGELGQSIPEKKELAELRKIELRTKREEILLEQVRGNLMSKKEIEEKWGERVTIVRSGLLAFADRLSPLLVGKSRKQIAKIIEAEVYALLNAYSKRGKHIPDIGA